MRVRRHPDTFRLSLIMRMSRSEPLLSGDSPVGGESQVVVLAVEQPANPLKLRDPPPSLDSSPSTNANIRAEEGTSDPATQRSSQTPVVMSHTDTPKIRSDHLTRVAVGTAPAGGPPHRSQRRDYRTGLLPHVLAAKRTCGKGCITRDDIPTRVLERVRQVGVVAVAIAGWAVAPWKGAFLVALAQCIAYGGSGQPVLAVDIQGHRGAAQYHEHYAGAAREGPGFGGGQVSAGVEHGGAQAVEEVGEVHGEDQMGACPHRLGSYPASSRQLSGQRITPDQEARVTLSYYTISGRSRGVASEELPGVINQLAASDCSSASVTSWRGPKALHCAQARRRTGHHGWTRRA